MTALDMRALVIPVTLAIVVGGCADLVGADFERQPGGNSDASVEGGSPISPPTGEAVADTGAPPSGPLPDDAGIAPRDASGLE